MDEFYIRVPGIVAALLERRLVYLDAAGEPPDVKARRSVLAQYHDAEPELGQFLNQDLREACGEFIPRTISGNAHSGI